MLSCSVFDSENDNDVPQCIEDIIFQSYINQYIKTIQTQTVDGEIHYWINTDFRHADGIEYIVNGSCDTICGFCGECIPPPCAWDYEVNSWDTLWVR